MNSRVAIGSFAALTLLASAAGAQSHGERDSVQVRNGCRLAAQILTSGHPDPHYEWALSVIGECEISGPATLGAVWQKATDDTVALGRLVYESQLLRDRRLLDAVLAVAADGTRPEAVRLAAVRTLVSYHSPGRDVFPSMVDKDANLKVCVLSWVDHFGASEGDQPIESSDRGRIVDALRALSSDTSVLGRVARCAVQGIAAEGSQ